VIPVDAGVVGALAAESTCWKNEGVGGALAAGVVGALVATTCWKNEDVGTGAGIGAAAAGVIASNASTRRLSAARNILRRRSSTLSRRCVSGLSS